MRRLPVKALAGAAVGVGVGVAAGRLRRSTRARRNVQMARVSSRLGASVAATRARQVFASAERREQLQTELELKTGQQVAEALGNMKGAMMKLGQLASFLDDGLPEPIRAALASLQQDAPPMSGALAASVIEAELGTPPSKLFARWDPVPIAAASIGQVHRALTHDDVAVAVKVQYPGVDEAIKADLDNSDMLFGIIGMVMPGFDPKPLVDEIRERVSEELDYRLEADNQTLFVEHYRDHPFIHVPAVVPSLSARRVLTTELADGVRFAELDGWSQEERNLAGEAIYRFVFRSIYDMHAFNGDPHPGNYLFRPGGHVTFLDFGLVKKFTAEEVVNGEQTLRHIVFDRDIAAYRRSIEETGILRPGAPVSDDDIERYFGHFYEIVMEDREVTFTHTYAAELVQRLFDLSGKFGDIARYANIPASMVIIQRINLGLYSVLASLNATANWRRIAEELWPMVRGPASTDLGRQEAAWLATR
jgi:predicted unusual protein kinase regulating ubiquinone biosynthesis (AarF/ABC1/UbiB family)